MNYFARRLYHYIRHLVIGVDKNTSKVRKVFDEPEKSERPSLNECLYRGLQLTSFIFYILIRFRTFAIALISDIEKVFLQININEHDRDYLRSFGLKMLFVTRLK